MQKFAFIIFLIVSGSRAFSQPDLYLYLQSDERQPFYARISSSIYSSSESGYLIIPKLSDSIYSITIGFAKNVYPEQQFVVNMNKSDKGYQIRKTADGWSLVNLQNKSVIPGTGALTKKDEAFSGERKTDPFSQLLANVVNDSSILYTAVIAAPQPGKKPATQNTTVTMSSAPQQQPVAASEQPAIKPDSISPALPEVAAIENKTATATLPDKAVPVPATSTPQQADINPAVATAPDLEKPFIIKVFEQTTAYQYTATYLEQYNYKTDTVRIAITLAEKPVTNMQETAEKPGPLPDQAVASKSTVGAPANNNNSDSGKKQAIVLLNSDCKNIAGEHDVDRLRIKLLAENAVDDKLVTAKKYFRNRCFTVKQISALSELFPTDETKYRFFDTSYPFVSDTGNIYQLGDLIQNDYYKNRFKAMIHQ